MESPPQRRRRLKPYAAPGGCSYAVASGEYGGGVGRRDRAAARHAVCKCGTRKAARSPEPHRASGKGGQTARAQREEIELSTDSQTDIGSWLKAMYLQLLLLLVLFGGAAHIAA